MIRTKIIMIVLIVLVALSFAGCIQNEVQVTVSVRDKTNWEGIYAIVTQDGETIGLGSETVYNSLEPGNTYLVVLGGRNAASQMIVITKVLHKVDIKSEDEE